MKSAYDEKILIIDDSLDNHTLLRICLEALGFETLSAHNGEEALTLLRELTALPKLILLDNRMPKMGGEEFRRVVKRDKRLKSIPIFVMSADSDILKAPDLVEPQRIFGKPLPMQDLLSAVQSTFV